MIRCLEMLVEKNSFATVSYLLSEYYAKEKSAADISELETTIRRAMTRVRSKQDDLIELLSTHKQLTVVAPAFRWAQSLGLLLPWGNDNQLLIPTMHIPLPSKLSALQIHCHMRWMRLRLGDWYRWFLCKTMRYWRDGWSCTMFGMPLGMCCLPAGWNLSLMWVWPIIKSFWSMWTP